MSVNIFSGPPTYNKAPAPDKAPSEKLYPIKTITEKGDQIWVSLPQPDKLHLTVVLRPEHFAKGFKPSDPHDYGRMIMQALATGHAGAVSNAKYVEHAHLYTQLQIQIDEPGQLVFFSLARTYKKADGPHTLTIQLNPRLLTQYGIYELIDRLHLATGKRLLVGKMLSDTRVSRLDVAVDIVGVGIADLLVRTKKEGKRRHTNGKSGALEAIEVWATGKKKAVAEQRSLIVYDKRQECIDNGVTPPHGPAPVTRIEITKKRFGPKVASLTELGKLPNPLGEVVVGSVHAACKPLSQNFLRYVDARRAADQERAASHLNLSAERADEFEACYLGHASDLMDGGAIWDKWADGLLSTGASLLIEAAQKKSIAVPWLDEME